jgi:3-hydroxymyristoyl/3-hydroxydecanoyl-(acyl carrier protein) dehydratase
VRPIGTFTVSSEHPSLPGHFPGNPVIPGVVLLDEMLGVVAQATGLAAPLLLQRAKFEGMAVPDQTVTVLIEEQDTAALRFRCEAEGRRLVSGSLCAMPSREP